MSTSPKHYDEESYHTVYNELILPKTRVRLYSVSDIEDIKSLIGKYFGKKKVKNTLTYFKDLAMFMSAFKNEKGEKVRVTRSYLRNIYFINSNKKYRNLSKEDKQKIFVKKHSRVIDAILGFLNNYFEKQSGTDIGDTKKLMEFELEDWYPNTRRSDTPRNSDFMVLPLHGCIFKRIICTIFSRSSYYRFGIKFIGGATFSQNDIQTLDDNVFIHTGMGSMTDRYRDNPFTALYIKGDRALKNGLRSKDQFTDILLQSDEGYECEVFVDEDDMVRFRLDGKEFESALASKNSQTKVYLFAWADNQEYELIVKKIKLEILNV